MKVKISISMDQETITELDLALKNSIFRNKSHFVEVATKRYLREVRNE